jgi:hypothetical protein
MGKFTKSIKSRFRAGVRATDSRPATCCPPPSGDGGRNIPAVRPARHAPCQSASPSTGVAGERAGQAGCQLTNASSHLRTSLSSPTATWASVARGSGVEPACYTTRPAVSIAEFSALYERCMASGLKAHVVISHATGAQTITLTCNMPASSAAATSGARRRRRCRRRRRRRREATTVGACTEGSLTSTAASATTATAGGSPPTPPSPEVMSPPPKRVRRRRNELELLRDAEGEGELLLSPLSCTSPSPPSPSPPPSSSPSPSRSLTPSSASPSRPPSTPLDHVPALPPTCPPTPPERPEPSPPAESAPASLPPPPPAADLPTPSTSPGYTIVYLWCPNCKTSLMDNREFECYACQDRRYYYSVDYEQE